MIQIFTLALGANEAREVAVVGEYFELRNALFPVALIELLDRSGNVISRLENPEQSDFVKPGRYETVRITNGPTAQTIKHFYGSGDAGSRRTSGLVRIDGTSVVMIVDGELDRSKSGKAFSVYAAQPPVAAQYSYLELWNPGASGKRAIVSDVLFSGNAAGAYQLMRTVTSSGAASVPASKSSGVPGAPACRYGQGATATPGGGTGTILEMAFAGASVPLARIFKQPFVVEPGSGLLVVQAGINQNMYGAIQFMEEAI